MLLTAWVAFARYFFLTLFVVVRSLTGKYNDGIPEDRATRRDLRALEYEDKITPEIRDKIDAIADFKPELTKVQDNVDQMRGKWQ
ncbi:hypothetical protein GN244_ATG12951 [Phytophthora infestans]|uniref:Uncharacterized protein n=1 Tax=Phytophthora infestans TaxID=4787 RepID=A0A833SIV8_PHYIN|nr:hypothetical protein GN244_ATG12951 [Phytophthora infestans]